MPSKPLDPAPLRVLVCEDFADVAQLFAEMLRLRGHHVELVDSGRAGLTRILAGGLDVAVVDIGLPDLDGFELARRVRHANLAPRIRLVALTGHGSPADRESALVDGFDEYLVKPVRMELLLTALRPPVTPGG